MKLPVLVLLAVPVVCLAFPLASPPAGGQDGGASVPRPPDCQIGLTLPDSSLSLRARYRQVGPDLSPFRVPSGADETEVRQHQVLCLFAQGSSLTSDVALRAGEHVFRAGSHSFGFVVDARGVPEFFMVEGRHAHVLPSRERPVEWPSRGLLMQWEYEDRGTVHLVWKLLDKAGAIEFRLGDAPAVPPDHGVPDVDADAPR